MKDADLRDALYEAFVAGFSISGEGFNAEWPFGDKLMDPRKSVEISARFDKWLEEFGLDVSIDFVIKEFASFAKETSDDA